MKKQIVSETKNYQPSTVDELLLDDAPKVNSFNGITSDGVARAIAGASGEVPVVTESDNGKVLTAIYDEGGAAVEWAEAQGGDVDQTYDATSTNAQSGVAVAQAIAAIPSASYTAGDGIDITNDEISAKVGSGLEIGTSLTPVTVTAHALGYSNPSGYFDSKGPSALQQLDASLVHAIETTGLTFTIQNLIDNNNESQTWFYDSSADPKLYPAICKLTTDSNGTRAVANNALVLSTTGIDVSGSIGVIPAGTQFTYNLSDINRTLSTTNWATISASPENYSLGVVVSTPVGVSVLFEGSANFTPNALYDAGTISYQYAVTGAITVSNPLPASAVGDAGKVLTVNSSGRPAWGMLGSVQSIQQVNSLPATPDANTLYLIPEA